MMIGKTISANKLMGAGLCAVMFSFSLMFDNDESAYKASINNNYYPVANFVATPTEGRAPLMVSFDAQQSSDTDGTIESYEWDFGDGNTGIGEQVSHTYSDGGYFTATLVVTDDIGDKGIKSYSIFVRDNTDPVSLFTYYPSSGKAPLKVELNASSSYDSDGSISLYKWYLGDGTYTTGKSISHTYTQSGEFDITLEIEDNEGGRSLTTSKVVVEKNNPPEANFSLNPQSGSAPLRVSFNAGASRDSDGTIADYIWDFGDAVVGNGVQASNVYETAGYYTAQLTVIDDGGLSSTSEKQILVSQTDTFEGSSSMEADNNNPSSNQDYLNQNNTLNENNNLHNPNPVTEPTPVKTPEPEPKKEPQAYSGPNKMPTVSFKKSYLQGSLKVKFDASLSRDSDGSIEKYLWDLGDGTKKEGKIVYHKYKTIGSYSISLTVVDNRGGISKLLDRININTKVGALSSSLLGQYAATMNVNRSIDGDMDLDEFFNFLRHYELYQDEEMYKQKYDYNNDNKIDKLDYNILMHYYRKKTN